MSNRAGIVARVSQGDADDGAEEHSNAEQRADCEGDCKANDWAVTDFYEAVESASTYGRERRGGRDREEWVRLAADVRSGRIGVVVAWEQSRLSREMTEWSAFLDLCKAKAVLIRITDEERTYDVRRHADWEHLIQAGYSSAKSSNDTSRRIRRAVTAYARDGRPHGKTYGYEHTYESRREGRSGARRRRLASQVP
jgi:DNA invertase Pin-like site-specific DNA recombinase